MPTPNDKVFDKNTANECDPKANYASTQVCLAFGMCDIRENDESVYTGHIYDLIANYRGKDVRIETELKKDWGPAWSMPNCHPEVPYKWPTMDFPYRKRDKAKVHANFHDVVGRDLRRVFRVPRKVILESPVSEKWVRNRQCMEPFFNVALPAPCSAFWHKVDDNWQIARKWDKDLNLVIKDGVKQ